MNFAEKVIKDIQPSEWDSCLMFSIIWGQEENNTYTSKDWS